MLYTRKGDSGTTKLFTCDGRISKDDPTIEALGALDEANSWIGLCAAQSESDMRATLQGLQEDLFVIQAFVACAPKELSSERVLALEAIIADAEAELPPITSFVIPGATALSANLDVARTLARRAERRLVACNNERHLEVLPYINRLSSVLYALARLDAHRAGVQEVSPNY